jgi:hypothetical protein
MKKLIPFLSLGWGVFSVFFITHNNTGIGKLFFFSTLFIFAGLAGFFFVAGKNKVLDWLKIASQQAALQYILFFAIPLLWRAENWTWLLLTGITGASTLWDPLFNSLWQRKIYRMWTVITCLLLLAGLALILYAPNLFYLKFIAPAALSLTVYFILSTPFRSSGAVVSGTSEHSFADFRILFKQIWQPLLLCLLFSLTPTPLPPLGIWLNAGEIKFDAENKSMSCETRIASPDGFKGKVVHIWEFSDPRILRDEITLPEISGNGIDEKPFRTISRKKAFSIPYEEVLKSEIRCSVELPHLGRVGKITHPAGI